MPSNTLKQTGKKQLKFYKGRGLTKENGAFAVGWKNDHAQEIRFEKLTELFANRISDFSLNDLGCGLGHYHDYLMRSGFSKISYSGYDVLEKMISEANKIDRIGRSTFQFIDHAEAMKKSDFSVCSGIFNLKFDHPTEEWVEYIFNTLEVLYEKSEYGFAFNALTSFADEERKSDELFYANPSKLFEFCLRNFSKNVSLLHDYHQHDFTIIVRK
ncbi:MAG: hypothetical protein JKY54_17450 [Flavobacteriales bacterium]|nr:hypothetical protein [Flavobacteriales bacterium]